MTYGSEKIDEYVTDQYRTSSGNESITYLIRKEGVQSYKCYSSAHDSGVGGSCNAGSTWAPDGASGFSTLVGADRTKRGAKALGRKATKALHIGWLAK